MHAADAAGGKDADPCQMGADHRRGDRGGPGAARGDTGRQIGARQLCDTSGLTQRGQLRVGQPDMDAPVHHRDGGWGGAMGADLGLDQARGFHVLRKRHAVGDDGGFKRHDGGAIGARCGDFG